MTVKRGTGAECMERLWGKTDKKQEMASTAASKKATGGCTVIWRAERLQLVRNSGILNSELWA